MTEPEKSPVIKLGKNFNVLKMLKAKQINAKQPKDKMALTEKPDGEGNEKAEENNKQIAKLEEEEETTIKGQMAGYKENRKKKPKTLIKKGFKQRPKTLKNSDESTLNDKKLSQLRKT
ncbi:uncharacterized protein BdWA1_004149 [Babesia duncani]|uniref:Uncharacterized protein n=1 Tax=Babesia duncani TaxID=323732 RepID=A0AAD9UM78_9APIC|nr:hypothetical protein BdWA1_004149 [Babesia duncani]